MAGHFILTCKDCGSHELSVVWLRSENLTAKKSLNAWMCWPEPRFKESWANKNWIRPDR
jgi:hypothetical protein